MKEHHHEAGTRTEPQNQPAACSLSRPAELRPMRQGTVLLLQEFNQDLDPVEHQAEALAQLTGFNREQIKALYVNFMNDSKSLGYFDRSMFLRGLDFHGVTRGTLRERLYELSCTQEKVNFDSFVKALSLFLPLSCNTREDSRRSRASLTFQIVDTDGDGMISRMELLQWLTLTFDGSAKNSKELMAVVEDMLKALDISKGKQLEIDPFLEWVSSTIGWPIFEYFIGPLESIKLRNVSLPELRAATESTREAKKMSKDSLRA